MVSCFYISFRFIVHRMCNEFCNFTKKFFGIKLRTVSSIDGFFYKLLAPLKECRNLLCLYQTCHFQRQFFNLSGLEITCQYDNTPYGFGMLKKNIEFSIWSTNNLLIKCYVLMIFIIARSQKVIVLTNGTAWLGGSIAHATDRNQEVTSGTNRFLRKSRRTADHWHNCQQGKKKLQWVDDHRIRPVAKPRIRLRMVGCLSCIAHFHYVLTI